MSETRELRRCLLAPIPELDEAVDLLSEAADALLAGNEGLARDCIQRADIAAIHNWASRIMGRVDDEIHQHRPVAGPADPVTRVVRRMPGRSVQAAICARDGYRCRFCGCRVVLPTVRPAMEARIPGAIRWGRNNSDQHAAFFALTATIDHLVPHAKGGSNDPMNLLTTCQACNFGRSVWLIEEVGLVDPRMRAPVVDGWDGLMRLAASRQHTASPAGTARAVRATRVTAGPRPAVGTVEGHAEWLAGLERASGASSKRLLELLDDCRDLQVFWTLKHVLLVKMSVGGRTLSVLGIEAGGGVQVPWDIGEEKSRFRGFAETLAAGIPGAAAYETPKMWRVGRPKGGISVLDILDASDALRAALRELDEELRN